jgi:Zn-dependent alcohol dehydrogenase
VRSSGRPSTSPARAGQSSSQECQTTTTTTPFNCRARCPHVDIPRLLNLAKSGKLKLDDFITRRYTLDQINEGYADLLAGQNIRGVIIHEQ